MSSKGDKKIKNVVIVNDFDYVQGGASNVAIETANIIASTSDNISVFFFCGKHDDKSNVNKKVKVICLNQEENLNDKNILRGFKNGIYNSKAKKDMKKLLSSLDPNETIIHVHGWTKVLSSSIFNILFQKNFKVVLTLHDYFSVCPNGGFFNYKKNKICNLNPMSLKCITCNCDSRNIIFKAYRVIRQLVQDRYLKKKIKHVISISDLSENVLKKYLTNAKYYRVYNPISFPINIKHCSSAENYLYIGRVDKEKGVEDFCKCMDDLKLKGIVIGTGNEHDYLKAKYKDIDFVGWKDRNDIINYLSKAKALIFPSLWYETAGLTILEALSQGVPCYVRSTTAGSEFIQDGLNGYLFNDLDDLKTKISKNNDKQLKFSFDGKKYSNEVYYKNIVSVYETIIGGEDE